MVRTLVAALAVASLLLSGSVAVADLVGRALSTDPDIFTNFNPVDPDYDITGDMFGIRSRANPDPPGCVNCMGIPFAVSDDSLIIFPGDSAGIIKDADFDDFFGVADTVNGTGNNINVATWTFDISTVTSGLMVSIDMAAMGNFEDDVPPGIEDLFVFEYSIDGGGFAEIFRSTVTEGIDQDYTMEDGMTYTVPDPMDMNGTRLINDFQTLTAPIAGSGSSLELRFSAQTDGSPEAFAFRNVLVEGSTGSVVFEADFDSDGDVDGDDFLLWQVGFGANITSGAGKTDGDWDNDGDVDGDDFLGWQAEFPSPGAGAGASAVPEPAAICLLVSLGLAVIAFRMRRG